MFLRFTKKFSRPKLGFIIALFMLFAPAFILTTVESAAAQRNKKPAPTPKKKATPDKKTQAKTAKTPARQDSKSSKNAKNTKETASKNKSNDKRNDKRSDRVAKNDRNSKNDRSSSKNAKTNDRRNSKQTLAANNKIPSKNSRSDRNAKSSDKNRNSADRNSRQERSERNKLSASKNAKPAVAKTTEKKTSRRTVETKPRTENTRRNAVQPVVETEAETSVKNSEIIVATYSAPVRSQASQSAPLLSNVKLGSVLRVAEKKADWYKIEYWADGKTTTGWIPAAAVNDLSASGRGEVYRSIVDKTYKPQMDFETASEFYEFTSKVGDELDGSERSGEIELKRLLALRSALKTIPADKRESSPYKNFLKNQERAIVYNEPAGEWLVISNEFWNLHNKYRKTEVSETIAWEAANNPLPGECEGYVNCYLFDMRMRFGEYLNLHPNGKRAAEALKNITDYLSPIAADATAKSVYNGPTDVTDRAEFNNLIAELRTIVARLQFVEKEKTLQQLRTIAEAYR